MRRLLIVDHYESSLVPLFDAAAGAVETDVLVVGRSAEWLRVVHGAAIAAGRCRILDAAPWAGEAHELVRSAVLEIVPTLPMAPVGNTTLGGLAHGPGNQSWWFFEIAEKGPYRGPLIEQLYRLALISRACEAQPYDEVVHSLADRALAAVLPRFWRAAPAGISARRPPLSGMPRLRYWVHALRAAALALIARVVSSLVAPGMPTSGSTATISMFPDWWSNPWSADPRDRFFSPSEGSSREAGLTWLLDPVGVWRSRRTVRASFARLRLWPLQRFVAMRDVMALLSVRRYARCARFLRVRTAWTQRWLGFDVGSLVADEITRSWTGAETAQDQLLERALARAMRELRPSRVVYRCEFQPAEHAILRGAAAAGPVPRYGYVHFPFGRRYLSMQFAPSETQGVGRRGADDCVRPMPDGLLTPGSAVADNAAASGFPSDRIAVCGPQRYGGLQQYLRARPSRADVRSRAGIAADRLVIFVALAIVEGDTEALCAALLDVAAEHQTALFLIRPHPNLPEGAPVLQRLMAALGARARLLPPAVSVYDQLSASDLMISIGSMIVFEAVVLGVVPIVFENPCAYAATSLAAYEEGLFLAHDGRTLCESVMSVQVHSEAVQRKIAAWPRLTAAVFGDLSQPLGEQLQCALEVLERRRA